MSTTTIRAGVAAPPIRPRLTWRQNLVTMLLAAVMELGGILDAWAHVHLPDLETVITPWHGVLYGGYAATVGWIALQVLRLRGQGFRGRACIPVGYGLGVVGAAIWAVGGAFDVGLWHQVFGFEEGLELLLSPTHLTIGLGEVFLITSPLRAAWSDPAGRRGATFRGFLPALLSAMFAVQLAGFFVQFFNAFTGEFPSGDLAVIGVAAVLTSNALLIGSVLLLTRRWQTPAGSFTALFLGVVMMLGAINELRGWPTFAAAAAGGAVADLLVRRLAPSPTRPAAYRVVAVGSSLAMWSTYMAVAAVAGLDWSVTLSTGAIALAVGSSAGLALLAEPGREGAPAA